MATTPHILTYEEWLRMPPVEDGTDEVVKGELRFMPPTRYPHAEIIRRLTTRMDRQVSEDEIAIFGSNFGLMISREPLTCRSPDIAVYWAAQMVIQDGLYYSPPGLIVEVLSPSENHKRKMEKLQDYASIGVPEVWVCSPTDRTIEVWKLVDGKLVCVTSVTDGIIEPAKFAGIKIAVSEIWPE